VRGSYRSAPGAGCAALALAPGTATQEELLARVGEGILIADVAGLHSGVNPVSGDLSVGAEGLAIRGGAATEPLREFTIATTLQRLLTDVDAIGGDLEWLPMGAAGVSLVVRDAGNLPKLVPALNALGARHAALDVGPADYDAVGQALILTLAEMLGDAFTPAARAAWTQAYAAVAGAMMQGAASASAMSA
jgi:hypothetical protein